MKLGNCGQCGFYVASAQACLRTQTKVDAAKDSCSAFNTNPNTCEICGTPLTSQYFDEGHILCHNCVVSLGTCSGCSHYLSCDFETNPSELPKTIVKTIQQNGMTLQTQVRNPERVEITCKNGCLCFDAENGCLRQFGICGNHIHEWPIK